MRWWSEHKVLTCGWQKWYQWCGSIILAQLTLERSQSSLQLLLLWHFQNWRHSLPLEEGVILSLNYRTNQKWMCLWHDGDHFCMDSSQVAVFKKTNQVCLHSLLQCIVLRLGDENLHSPVVTQFLNELLEGQPMYQKICGVLIPPYFSQGQNSKTVPAVPGLWVVVTSAMGHQSLMGIPDDSMAPRLFASGKLIS